MQRRLRDLRQLLASALTLGLLSGFLLSFVKGAASILENRYLELGMYRVALPHLQAILNASFAFPVALLVVFLAAELGRLLVDSPSNRWLRSLCRLLVPALALAGWGGGLFVLSSTPRDPLGLVGRLEIQPREVFTLGCLFAAGVPLLIWVVAPALRGVSEASRRSIEYLLLTLVLVVWAIVVYQLNAPPRVPFLSRPWLYQNGGVTVGLLLLAGLAIRFLPGVAAALTAVGRRGPRLRHALGILALLAGGNALVQLQDMQGAAQRMNLLLITVDTLRADHLGCYGHPRATSPHIDELAREGTLFAHAVAQWPVTSPSIASLLTGTYGYHHGVKDVQQRLAGRFVLLAEVLKNAGFQTAGVVHSPTLGTEFNFHQGFDSYVQPWQVADPKIANAEAEYVTDRGLEWLRSRGHAGGFFLWLHYIDPHTPYKPPAPYQGMFVGDALYTGARRAPLHEDPRDGKGGVPGWARLADPATPGEFQDRVDYYVAEYDASIRYMDDNVGRVLAEIRTLGLADDTIVVFTADHGESLGDHDLYFVHGAPYDSDARVPLIIRIPGLEPAAVPVVARPVALIDVMPTLLDVLAVPAPPELQGSSLRPAMLGDESAIPEFTFTESGSTSDYQRAIRKGRWKLIYVPDAGDQQRLGGAPFELYDTERDPEELHNRIDEEPAIAAELKKALFAWLDIARGAAPAGPSRKQVVDERTEDALRVLGYVE